MAKSLKSKWVKARKAERRVKYAKREMVKFKQMINNRDMKERLLKEISSVVNKIKKEPVSDTPQTVAPSQSIESCPLLVNLEENFAADSEISENQITELKSESINNLIIEEASLPNSEYNLETLQNKHGNFPPWMNRRSRRKFKEHINYKDKSYWMKNGYIKEKLGKRRKHRN